MEENRDDLKDFFEKELWPQLNPGKVLIDKAEESQKQGKLEDAILYLEGALLVDPNNSRAQEKLGEVKELRAKRLAHDFAERFYPSQLREFESCWREFKDTRPEDFSPPTIQADRVGSSLSSLEITKAIILMNHLFKEGLEALPDAKLQKAIIKVGRAIGCSLELMVKIISFTARQ